MTISCRLMPTDDMGEAIGTIDGLHESVLETEPTGREMGIDRARVS